MSTFEPVFRAIPVPRGCGERTPGGLYAESGLGPNGRPLEDYLIDPPLPLPEGLDLVNKPQIVDDPETGIPHLWLWIGAEWYPYCSDYVEEARHFGASRKLNSNLDLQRLVPGSRMILAHPYARNLAWHEQLPPHDCFKQIPGHALIRSAPEPSGMAAHSTMHTEGTMEAERTGEDDLRQRPPAALSVRIVELSDDPEADHGSCGGRDKAVNEAERDTREPPRDLGQGHGHEVQPESSTDLAMLIPAPAGVGSTTLAAVRGWRRPEPQVGPCLFKTYELVPVEAAADVEHPILL